MAQRPKSEMRQAILDAAAREFAEVGFARATLATISHRADTSIGNLYKYFSSKDDVFAAAIPPGIAEALHDLVQLRVRSLGSLRDVRSLTSTHAYRQVSERLIKFSLASRWQILFLLRHGEGTPFVNFADTLVKALVRLAVEYAAGAYPTVAMTAAHRRSLGRIYRAFLGTQASMLAEEKSEAAFREAGDHLTAFHLAGLKAFFERAQREARS